MFALIAMIGCQNGITSVPVQVGAETPSITISDSSITIAGKVSFDADLDAVMDSLKKGFTLSGKVLSFHVQQDSIGHASGDYKLVIKTK